MLLAASLSTADTIWDVRLRNVSETGALIEGSGLPHAGATVLLRRSKFEIDASVAWSSGTRCGVAFSSPVELKAIVEGSGRVQIPSATHQRRVDDIQRAVRSGVIPAPTPSRPSMPAESEIDTRIAEELGYVQRLLAVLGDALVADPVMLRKHGGPLQNLDMASQLLGQLAAVLTAADRAEAVAAMGNADLRARLSRRSHSI